jgi:excisionase family DNA binding protein
MSRERRVKLTPPQLAKRYGVSPDKVLTWIRAGELRAVNVASRPGERPRWLIDETDVAAFEARRAAQATARVPRRSRRAEQVIEFF